MYASRLMHYIFRTRFHVEIQLPLAKVEYSKDLVSESGKEFTDGCGEMALDVMKSIYSTPAFAHVDDSKPLPSAIQVRFFYLTRY